jgi:L-serine deaminase
MQVDDAVDAVIAVLQCHELADRAEIIAEMEIAGGLHSGKDERLEAIHDVLEQAVGRPQALDSAKPGGVTISGGRGPRAM